MMWYFLPQSKTFFFLSFTVVGFERWLIVLNVQYSKKKYFYFYLKNFQMFVYIKKYSIIVSEQTILYSAIAQELFFWDFHT